MDEFNARKYFKELKRLMKIVDKEKTKSTLIDEKKILSAVGESLTEEELALKKAKTPNEIRTIFSGIKYVSSGANGSVYTSDSHLNSNQKIIVKILKDTQDDFHEPFIGLFGTNFLRDKIPNFNYVLGARKCSSPIAIGNTQSRSVSLPSTEQTNGEGLEWCSSKGEEKYYFFEWIDGITLSDFLNKKRSLSSFVKIFTQIIFALIYANDEIDFTHYDLSTDNVMLRDTSSLSLEGSKNEVTYDSLSFISKGNKKGITISTEIEAVVIDFNFSHIKYKNNNYGNELKEFNILNKSNIFGDIWKLITSTLEKIPYKNEWCKNIVDYLLRVASLIIPISEKMMKNKKSLIRELVSFADDFTYLPLSATKTLSKKKFIKKVYSLYEDTLVIEKSSGRRISFLNFPPLNFVEDEIKEENVFSGNLNSRYFFSKENFSENILIEGDSSRSHDSTNGTILVERGEPLTMKEALDDKLRLIGILVSRIENYRFYNEINHSNKNSFFISENISGTGDVFISIKKAEREIELFKSFRNKVEEDCEREFSLLDGVIERYNSSVKFIEYFRGILKKLVTERILLRNEIYFSYKFKYF